MRNSWVIVRICLLHQCTGKDFNGRHIFLSTSYISLVRHCGSDGGNLVTVV
jgi:hypothetical protein